MRRIQSQFMYKVKTKNKCGYKLFSVFYFFDRLLMRPSGCSQLGLCFCGIFVCVNPFFLDLDSRTFSVSTF
jgi:hypothetical protein